MQIAISNVVKWVDKFKKSLGEIVGSRRLGVGRGLSAVGSGEGGMGVCLGPRGGSLGWRAEEGFAAGSAFSGAASDITCRYTGAACDEVQDVPIKLAVFACETASLGKSNLSSSGVGSGTPWIDCWFCVYPYV
jgi:hypothetical protein